MISFVVSTLLFLVLVIGVSVVGHRQRRRQASAPPAALSSDEADQAIYETGGVAVRRHTSRFGREPTGVHEILSAHSSKSPTSKSGT
jgi:hypothetical protein